MSTVMKTLRFPKEILEEIRPIIKKEKINFTSFVITAIKNYIESLKFSAAINKSHGSWNDNQHNELKNGVKKYIRNMRKGRNI